MQRTPSKDYNSKRLWDKSQLAIIWQVGRSQTKPTSKLPFSTKKKNVFRVMALQSDTVINFRYVISEILTKWWKFQWHENKIMPKSSCSYCVFWLKKKKSFKIASAKTFIILWLELYLHSLEIRSCLFQHELPAASSFWCLFWCIELITSWRTIGLGPSICH